MAIFRRLPFSDTWHWMPNCTKMPTANYRWVSAPTRPKTGELCNECLAKERLSRR